MHSEVCNISKLDNTHLMKIVSSNTNYYLDESIKLYYVSYFIEGCTLEQFVKNNEVSFEEAKDFFEEFLDVLSYCHDKQILHRDIKPENIMLKNSRLQEFVLIDFGLSFNLDDNESITATNQQLGNRFLLLPELVSGSATQKRVVESDITQACGVFFYLLTGLVPNALVDGEGKPPHKRKSAKELLAQKITDNVVLGNIESIFDRAFTINIRDRYHSANKLKQDLISITDRRFNSLGGSNIDYGEAKMEISVYRYSELMKKLNPVTETWNPAGLHLPPMTNVNELMNFGVALPGQIKEKVCKYYIQGDYATAASYMWMRAVNRLRKRILSLGEEFVGDMVETDDIDYVKNLPAYRLIDLAYDLGFIDKAGKRKLTHANEFYNYYNNDEADEYEEMPQDEANIIIKNSIAYILYHNDDSFGLQFNDFREKLKTGKVTELYDDDKTMFETCPYFYLKTSVRSLLKLFGETDGIEFENVNSNMGILIPAFWGRLKIEERRAIADAYTDYTNKLDYIRIDKLNHLLSSVHGFDYVKENVRSRTYISVAQKLKDAHFGLNNFYTEPGIIKTLEDLGTSIPTLALKECVSAILYVKLGNQYGVSWDAQTIADRLLDTLSKTDWEAYIDKYMHEETYLVESILECIPIRNRWKTVIKKYNLDQLNIFSPNARKIITIR